MLSILIPVYNYNVNVLVRGLVEQCQLEEIDFEVILIDDASDQRYRLLNAKLDFLPPVSYFQNEYNVGRAKLRNTLASKAKFPYLLFMDCDAAVISKGFIRSYLDEIARNQDKQNYVINGGIRYRATPPEPNRYLRWLYGIKREEIPASVRNKNPYKSFTPFNVLMTKSIFEIFEFDESLTTYGHEDTLFGYQLKKNRIPYYHIDNQLYHDGLDANSEYLEKIDHAIDNLYLLIKDSKLNKFAIMEDIRLLKVYYQCKQYGLIPAIRAAYSLTKNKLTKKLIEKPSLFRLDIYKLGAFANKVKMAAEHPGSQKKCKE